MFTARYFEAIGLLDIYEKVRSSQRLTPSDGLRLFQSSFHNAIGALAAHVRFRRHGSAASYVVNRQINYTNICVNGCLFCAFRRDNDNEPGAFLMSHTEIMDYVRESASKGIDELHVVGGCHPELRLSWYENLVSAIRQNFPSLPIKAFTPVEIAHFARIEGIPTRSVLLRLKTAGVVMLPGGGAEIFDTDLRRRLCPQKADAAEWLRISEEAHELGMRTNCTMLFGHLENYEHRIDHLCRLREQQDRSGGFTCFIPLPFLKRNSRLKLDSKKMAPADGLDYLRTIAVSRLMLDNIPHIKAYWIMLGAKMAQTALWYGADDLDGTIVRERIGHEAGATSSQALTVGQLEDMIRRSGFTPVRRNALFARSGMEAVA